jgi:predicted SprT family Zn-dependent metalloprotease
MGRYHDLSAILTELRARYCLRCPDVEITWGRRSSPGRHRSIRFGVYQADKHRIRIHPVLDQPFVPRYFVEFIVYHELLHHLIPAVRVNGRYQIHSVEFRTCERAFPHYTEAIAWRRQHLRQLLVSAGTAFTGRRPHGR